MHCAATVRSIDPLQFCPDPCIVTTSHRGFSGLRLMAPSEPKNVEAKPKNIDSSVVVAVQ